MPFLRNFAAYLPERVLSNEELAPVLGKDPQWIYEASGIAERRIADAGQSVADLALLAAQRSLEAASIGASEVGMLIAASGSVERRFPGIAAEIAQKLGIEKAAALDVPMASAGALYALSLASDLVARYGRILVVAAEKMSAVVSDPATEPGLRMLFGDGAGACLVDAHEGQLEVLDYALESDGSYAPQLTLPASGPMFMNGMQVIMQAGRKVPAVIQTLLSRHHIDAQQVERFLMHQANQNLIDKIAKSLGVPSERFFTNIRRYGNTSSASVLIAASESMENAPPPSGSAVCISAFGAGFHWGALLARAV